MLNNHENLNFIKIVTIDIGGKMNPYKYVCDLPISNGTAAQESIEEALLSLLDEKELHKISVKEICEKAVMKGKAVVYHGKITHGFNIATRLTTRSFSGKRAILMNR